jgi:hypothetical protein
MSLEALPEELLVRTTGCLEKGDLAQLRLVNSKLQRIATEQFFRSITLYAHWRHEWEDDDTHSVDNERHNDSDELDYALERLGIPAQEERPDIFGPIHTDMSFFPTCIRLHFLNTFVQAIIFHLQDSKTSPHFTKSGPILTHFCRGGDVEMGFQMT